MIAIFAIQNHWVREQLQISYFSRQIVSNADIYLLNWFFLLEENKEEVLIPPKPQIQKKDPKIAQDTYKAKIFVDEINEVWPAEEPDFSFLK